MKTSTLHPWSDPLSFHPYRRRVHSTNAKAYMPCRVSARIVRYGDKVKWRLVDPFGCDVGPKGEAKNYTAARTAAREAKRNL